MTKITALPADTSPTTDDITITVDTTSGQAKKVTLSDLITLINTSGSPLASNFNNPYKFSVYRNAAWSQVNSPTKVAFDTKTFDTGSNFDLTNNRFIAPVAGFYYFGSTIAATISNNIISYVALYKNGSLNKVLSRALQSSGGNADVALSGGSIIQLSASDYVEVYYQGTNANGAITGSDRTFFYGFLVSAT